mgnify:CR=1 FL=1
MASEKEVNRLEHELDSFNLQTRKESLRKLMALVTSGSIEVPDEREIANLHCHSFFSYNGYGFSPSHLAWIAKKNGIKFMGIVDFDILDGVDEFLDACKMTGVRGTAGIETRVYIPEFKMYEINSPGEPGIAYHMGTGFISSKVPNVTMPALDNIRQRAVQRNQQIIDTVNEFLAPLEVYYEEDILPMTPGGYATERHMVQKIAKKSFESFEDPIDFWHKKLDLPKESIEKVIQDQNAFKNLLRKKLMKRGGVAYVQPDVEAFPTVDEFHEIILSADAIPCSAWLDGTSEGEQEIERLLDLLMEKGVRVINIVPDRNWNIAVPETKKRKIRELYHIVDLAQSLDLPIIVGTEMNSFGQKLVDDFDAPELDAVLEAFMKGAYFLYGHTRMAKLFGMGYQSQWSQENFANRKTRNAFYEDAGHLISPEMDSEQFADRINVRMSVDDVLKTLDHRIED